VLINAARARLSPLVHLWEDQEESPFRALAGLPLWHERAAGSLLGLVFPALWIQRRPCRAPGQAQTAWPGWEPTRAVGVRAGHFEPTREGQASACRLWSASGWPEGDAGRLRDALRSRFSRALRRVSTWREQRKGNDGSTPEPPGFNRECGSEEPRPLCDAKVKAAKVRQWEHQYR
jgi:hypothetical protein